MRTLAATMIIKNEMHNLPRLFKELNGLVDAIYITDTGSDDGSYEYITSLEASLDANCPVYTFEFPWIKDFSAARNHNLEYIKEDYWMWIDLDDSIANKNMFKKWKETSMHLYDAWYVPYLYAFDKYKNPVCSFIRERVIKTSLEARFTSFIHEAVDLLKYNANSSHVNVWSVNHIRTDEEAAADKGRNLQILLDRKDDLDLRLRFYLGKEYFDLQKFEDAAKVLCILLTDPQLSLNDRELAYQYAIQSLIMMKEYAKAIRIGSSAIEFKPDRAEYHCLLGDCYFMMGEINRAKPYYKAALGCTDSGSGGMSINFTNSECYDVYPRSQLAKIYMNEQKFHAALDISEGIGSDEIQDLRAHAYKSIGSSFHLKRIPSSEDIVITCPPQGAYPWDGELYREKGLGGSETAAVEMAEWMHKITGRNVLIFNPRESTKTVNGVQYISTKNVPEYFSKWKPKLHIAWRHPARLTDAPTVMWCHDLAVPGAEAQEYDKIIALSKFHSNYLQVTQGISEDKILISRNGLDPQRFKELSFNKEHGKIIWPNSPDRGLEFAMLILDRARKHIPDIKLNCFYGLDNLYKYGLENKANMLKDMIKDRPWVNYVGNVDQKTLAREFASSEVWLYSANFIETFCISALESMATKTYPVVKNLGALQNTLGNYKSCDILDLDYSNKELDIWAEKVVLAIEKKKYLDIDFDIEKHSWQSVAKEWVDMFNL